MQPFNFESSLTQGIGNGIKSLTKLWTLPVKNAVKSLYYQTHSYNHLKMQRQQKSVTSTPDEL
ncbi:hypothetical protein VRK_08950 [Vibrio sp. MEBiC08052]|nr:hypothetical protein VRK_08950 [Vibrio sp. MEBiC08052]